MAFGGYVCTNGHKRSWTVGEVLNTFCMSDSVLIDIPPQQLVLLYDDNTYTHSSQDYFEAAKERIIILSLTLRICLAFRC